MRDHPTYTWTQIKVKEQHFGCSLSSWG